jgi:CBS domain-containing protein
MKVREVMRKKPRFCEPGNTLAAAATAMAEVDCGVLPVVGPRKKVVGVITDRDICLALARGDRRPSEVTVDEVASGAVYACKPGDDVRSALETMRQRRVRRLVVVGEAGGLEGLLSLDDVVLRARALETADFSGPFYVDIAETLKAINQHAVPAVRERRAPPVRPRPGARKRAERGAEPTL